MDPESRSNPRMDRTSITAAPSLNLSISSTRSFFRRRLWIWPIIMGIALGVIGWFMYTHVEEALKRSMAGNLKAILNADVTALKLWLEEERTYAEAVAGDRRIQQPIQKLQEFTGTDSKATPATLQQAKLLARLRLNMKPWLEARKYAGFIVIDPKGRVIAAQRDAPVGKANLPFPERMLKKLFPKEPGVKPRSVITLPFRSPLLLEDENQRRRAGLPTMLAAAPILKEGKAVAAIGLRIRPQVNFTQILSVARSGGSGETYAFNKNGLLISQSRFDEELKAIGLLVDHDEVRSILNLEIRDPQANLMAGERPLLKPGQWGLTRMVAEATQGESGVDVEGYRDYRGVPVIGAWTWLPRYGFGVATEVDVVEAFRPLYILRYTFWGLFALVTLSTIIIFISTIIMARLRRQAQRATLKAKQLGHYTLEEKLGAGGIGVVYRGHHSMLRRPTAIKLLDIEKTTDETIARFEREVQLTSQLNHPNTVTIYDYGRTAEGLFYYVMEFLDGINLDDLVKQYGPQPEGRVLRILQQVCGSLAEAHGVGLIHRDIKPANIILCQRGGMSDVAKLLDFGLVKALDADREVALTVADSLTGTPLYASPEGISHPEQVDARSDLYAVGAVGYYLLAGKPVFDGRSIVEVCMHQVNTPAAAPSKRLGKPISRDLEAIILKCLDKNPDKRPQSAEELLTELQQCEAAGSWADEDAMRWWDEYEPITDGTAFSAATTDSADSSEPDVTLIAAKPIEEE